MTIKRAFTSARVIISPSIRGYSTAHSPTPRPPSIYAFWLSRMPDNVKWRSPEGLTALKSVVSARLPLWTTGLHPWQEEPIQRILDGEDVILCTATGDGNSALFLVPILCHLEASKYPDRFPGLRGSSARKSTGDCHNANKEAGKEHRASFTFIHSIFAHGVGLCRSTRCRSTSLLWPTTVKRSRAHALSSAVSLMKLPLFNIKLSASTRSTWTPTSGARFWTSLFFDRI